jgi:hypothetical protein
MPCCSCSLKIWPPACVRLFHGGGREALATYRTAAAVGKTLTSVLPARPPSPLPSNGRGLVAQRGFRPGSPLLRDGVIRSGSCSAGSP